MNRGQPRDEVSGGPQCLAARRRSLFVLSVVPVWTGSVAVFLSLWPWRPAVGHLAFLGLLGAILVELSLGGVQKIPFTCSYLPGRSNFHMTFWLSIGLVLGIIVQCAEFERRALANPAQLAAVLAVLGIVAVLARWRTTPANWEEAAVEFEVAPSNQILVLGLPRDGGATKPA